MAEAANGKFPSLVRPPGVPWNPAGNPLNSVPLLDCANREAPMLYFGPETIMPIASIFAGFVGMLLMFWRRTVGFTRFLFARLYGWMRGPGR